MSSLRKDITTTVIPGNPGSPGDPGQIAIPGHYITKTETVIEYVVSDGPATISYLTVYCSAPTLRNEIVRGSCYQHYGEMLVDVRVLLRTFITVPHYTTKQVEVWVPAVPARPSIPAIPPTPTQIKTYLNSNWNTWSHSAEQIAVGAYLSFSVAGGVAGAIVGIGSKSEVNHRDFKRLKHALVIDPGGVKVIENGVVKTTLMSRPKPVTEIRLFRRSDNVIVYFLITETDNIVYESTVDIAFPGLPLFVNAFLYSGGDSLTSTAVSAGKIQYGAA
ncbi:MAG: hypothetical protein PF589_12280 [Gammaproteobacteria bacterium]|nr:hypothetical protein [Gammaproteobacteria bacterium]